MADASDTMRFLTQKFDTAPAGTREEAEMAKELSETIHLHGLQTTSQDFSYPALGKTTMAIAVLVMALAGILAGFHVTVLSIICLVLGLAAGALYVLEQKGVHVLKGVGKPSYSQNLIARHPAVSNPTAAAGQKARPIVVIAHYDTPRADIMAIPALRGLQPYMELATFVAMCTELVTIVLGLLPLPTVVKSVLFAIAIVAAVVLVFQGARILLNRYVMPFTAGANDNMAGVAALLGLLGRVRPTIDSSVLVGEVEDGEGVGEADVRGEDAWGREAAGVSAAAGTGQGVDAEEERSRLDRRARRLATQPVRRGVEVLRSLGMVPESCEIEYEGAPAEADFGETMMAAPVGAAAADGMSAPADRSMPFEAPSVSQVHERIVTQEERDAAQARLAADDAAAADGNPGAAPATPGATMVITHEQLEARRTRRDAEDAANAQAIAEQAAAAAASEAAALDAVPAVPEQPKPFDVITVHDEPDAELNKTGIMLPKDVAQQQGNLLDDDEVRRDSILNSPTWGTTSFTPVSVSQNRRILEDVPDPSVAAVDPFSVANVETIGDYNPDDFSAMDFESGTHAAVTPAMLEDYKRRTTSGFDFGASTGGAKKTRGKKGRAGSTGRISHRAAEMAAQMQEESFSDWLGVEDDYDAVKNGRQMGSWNNFADDAPNGSEAAVPGAGASLDDFDDGAQPGLDGFYPEAPNGSQQGGAQGSPSQGQGQGGRRWQGGAASAAARRRGEGTATDEEQQAERRNLRQAAMQMGDRDLISHEIWFVLTGASEAQHAGAQAFFDKYGKVVRGAYVINLEAVGAGRQSLVVEEGRGTRRKANRRLVNLFGEASKNIGRPLALARMPWRETEATVAMRQGFHAVTVCGVDKGCPANARWTGDVPEKVNPGKIDDIVDIMVEVIKGA